MGALVWGCNATPNATNNQSAGPQDDQTKRDNQKIDNPTPDDPAKETDPEKEKEPDPEKELDPVVCTADEDKGECASSTEFYRCNAKGTAWDPIKCKDSKYCYGGNCIELTCPPEGKTCSSPKQLMQCQANEKGEWSWVEIDTCTDGICKNGKCVGGCGFEMKLNKGQDCDFWEAGFTPEPGESCSSNSLLVMPSSSDDKLAVFDIAVNPPTVLPGSPFPTCNNPSRILMDSDTDIVASCRSDGNIRKHKTDGTVIWNTQPPGCSAARGVALTGDGRLFAGCSTNGKVYELNHTTGEVIKEVTVGGYIYGLTADTDGLYVAQFSGIGGANKGVSKLHLGGANDLKVAWVVPTTIYGLAVDGNGKVWLGGGSNLRALDTETGKEVIKVALPSYVHGVAVGLDGNIYAGMGSKNQVAKVSPDGKSTEFLQLPAGDSHPRGVALDAKNNVYTVNKNSHNGTRFDGVTGQAVSFGPANTLKGPYGYSGDMTGLTSGCLVNTTSTWKSPLLEKEAIKTWRYVKWKSTEPEGTTVSVYYSIDGGPWTATGNTEAIMKVGTKFQVKVVMSSEIEETVATLHWVGVTYEE